MANIHDVARKARVSISTVSRVMNGNRPVQPEIRLRVLQAVEELGYRPNFLARGLRQSNTCMIGMLIPDNSNPFYAELARAIEDAGFAAGYSVILCNSDLSGAKQQAYIEVLLSHQVDGLILADADGVLSEATVRRIISEKIPVVLTNKDIPVPSLDQVLIDNYHGGCLAGEYLLGLQHRKIGCIALDGAQPLESARIAGFRHALAKEGLEPCADCFTTGNGRYDSGYAAMLELHSRCPDLSAVFVFNDLMALGAINALRSTGLRVPEDISVLGYDNIAFASSFEPALTVVAQPITAMGQECISLLLQRIQQPNKQPEHVRLAVELIERSSCQRLQSGS